MTIELTILGCGSSGGVPRVGQGWGTCDPTEPKNRRLRCSVLVKQITPAGTTTLLIDTSPDLREQLIAHDVNWLDGVLYTHEHADHTHGIDDLRGLALVQRSKVNVHAAADTLSMLHNRFAYCFTSPLGSDYPPILCPHLIEGDAPVAIEGVGGNILAQPVLVQHGNIPALGFKFGRVLYTPDLNQIPQSAAHHFDDLDVWIVDALREKQHLSHFSLNDALAAIERFSPKRAILTNLHNDMDYKTLVAKLPSHVEPAYDGMKITLSNIPT